jgi:hypothetical protein
MTLLLSIGNDSTFAPNHSCSIFLYDTQQEGKVTGWLLRGMEYYDFVVPKELGKVEYIWRNVLI